MSYIEQSRLNKVNAEKAARLDALDNRYRNEQEARAIADREVGRALTDVSNRLKADEYMRMRDRGLINPNENYIIDASGMEGSEWESYDSFLNNGTTPMRTERLPSNVQDITPQYRDYIESESIAPEQLDSTTNERTYGVTPPPTREELLNPNYKGNYTTSPDLTPEEEQEVLDILNLINTK